MSDKENTLYELLSTKKFSELNHEEQILVLEEVGSEEAYEEMRTAVQEEEKAPHDLKASVMEAYDEKHGRSKKVLWWKYAAAIAVIAVGTWIFWPAGNPENTQIAEQRDEQQMEEKDEPINKDEEKLAEPSEETEKESKPEAVADIDPPKDGAEKKSERIDEEITDRKVSEVAEIAESSEVESAGTSEGDFAENDMVQDESQSLEATKSKSTNQTMDDFILEQEETNQPAAARSMQANSFSAATSGINLREIGGPYPNAYVAY